MNNENMRLALRFFSLSLLLLPVRLSAQGIDDFFERFFQQRPRVQVEAAPENKSSGEVKLDYNVHMDYAFVNNEFDRSSSFFIPTGTIAAARVSPYIGLKIDRGELGRHRLMGGIDIMKNFGENPISWGAETSPSLENLALFREITLWYQYTRQFGETTFNMAAGVFPRHLCGGKYTTAVFSDGVRFFDNNAEGLLLKWNREKSNYEVILDWNGLIGHDRREQFNILSYGECYLKDWLQLGWQGMFHHYANSAAACGVVDDHFLNPFVTFNFAKMTSMQALSLSAGPFLAYQRDRRKENYDIPLGADFVLKAKKWDVGLRYEFYYGEDMMPLFGMTDNAGIAYGTNLYTRSGAWRISKDGSPSHYQNAEIYWEPRLAEFVHIKVSAIAHMNKEFIGWQQLLILNFDLDALRDKKGPKTVVKKESKKSQFYL